MPFNVIFHARNAREFNDEMRKKGDVLLWDRLSPEIQTASLCMEGNCRGCSDESSYLVGDEKTLFICKRLPFNKVPACASDRGKRVRDLDDEINGITRPMGVEF